MSTPTPAEAFARKSLADAHARSQFFHHGGTVTSDRDRVGQLRTDAVVAATRDVDALLVALRGLARHDERDLDLRLELFRRAANRADISLDRLDDALADSAGTPAPAPHQRHP